MSIILDIFNEIKDLNETQTKDQHLFDLLQIVQA